MLCGEVLGAYGGSHHCEHRSHLPVLTRRQISDSQWGLTLDIMLRRITGLL